MLYRTAIASTCALVAVLLVAPSSAAAQASDDELARSHFQAGGAYFDQARYEDAAREFLEAYRLSPRPELLLNASSAEERALHFDSAIELLERYLAEVPDAANRRTLEMRMERLRELRTRAQAIEHADAQPEAAATPTPAPERTDGAAASEPPAPPTRERDSGGGGDDALL